MFYLVTIITEWLFTSGRATPNDPVLLEDPGLVEIAKRLKKTVAQIILRYFIQRKVVVIPKSVTSERIKSNIQVNQSKITFFQNSFTAAVLQVFDFELSQKDMDAVSSANRDYRISTWIWYVLLLFWFYLHFFTKYFAGLLVTSTIHIGKIIRSEWKSKFSV